MNKPTEKKWTKAELMEFDNTVRLLKLLGLPEHKRQLLAETGGTAWAAKLISKALDEAEQLEIDRTKLLLDPDSPEPWVKLDEVILGPGLKYRHLGPLPAGGRKCQS